MQFSSARQSKFDSIVHRLAIDFPPSSQYVPCRSRDYAQKKNGERAGKKKLHNKFESKAFCSNLNYFRSSPYRELSAHYVTTKGRLECDKLFFCSTLSLLVESLKAFALKYLFNCYVSSSRGRGRRVKVIRKQLVIKAINIGGGAWWAALIRRKRNTNQLDAIIKLLKPPRGSFCCSLTWCNWFIIVGSRRWRVITPFIIPALPPPPPLNLSSETANKSKSPLRLIWKTVFVFQPIRFACIQSEHGLPTELPLLLIIRQQTTITNCHTHSCRLKHKFPKIWLFFSRLRVEAARSKATFIDF